MKILAVHQSSDLYGSDRSFLSAISSINLLESEDYEVCVVLPEKGPLSAALEKTGANVLLEPRGYLRRAAIKRPFRFILDSFLAFLMISRKIRNHDIVYINTVVCFSAILACIFTVKRKIVHVRELPAGMEMVAFRFLLRLSRAELIYNSAATRQAFRLPGQVIYNGVDSPVANECNHVESSDKYRPVRVLMLGRINSWKGQDLLVAALAKTERELEVRIVGSPIPAQQHLLDGLKRSASQLDTSKKIQFIEFTETPDKHLHWADYVVVPSLKPEPFGRVAIEGFAYGKPVIGAKHGGLVEIIKDSHNGFLFLPGSASALAELLDQSPHPASPRYNILATEAQKTYTQRFSLDAYQRAIRAFLLT